MKLKRNMIMLVAAAAVAIPLAGCSGDYAKVEQGRVIDFNADTKEVTLIHDSAMDSQHPVYDRLPPVVFKLPSNPAEVGPLPKTGQRMKLDVDQPGKEEIIIYDTNTKTLAHLKLENVDVKKPVDKTSPLVKDKKFPMIDKGAQTVTIYSARQKILCTFALPTEYAEYPASTWDAGDEVRFTFKTEGQMERFMNVSKTDIYKK
jgi:hypothetical protein